MMGVMYQISFSSSILIIFILFVRLLAAYKLPRKTFTLLWKIVLIRLLIPVSIRIPVPDIWTPVRRKVKLAGETLIPALLTGGVEGTEHSGEITSSKPSVAFILFAVWLVFTVMFLAIFLFTYIRSRMHVREALPSENEYARKWLSEQNIRRKIRILNFDRITSPMTIGIMQPKIILPKNMEMDKGRRLDYVLQHEMIHIKRFDIFWKMLSMLAACIHWYNPLVWLLYREFNKDIETACDERVIELFGPDAKPDYAYAIIQLMEKKPQAAFMYNGFGEKPVEKRIVSIMKLKKKTKTTMTISMIVILLSTMVFFNVVAIGAEDESLFLNDLTAFTEGENGKEHPKNLESRKYYPMNENGYTYGKMGEQPGISPDLVYVLLDNGRFGYVYSDEYLGSFNTNKNEWDMTKDTISTLSEQEINKSYNVYESDGETIIGTYGSN